MIKTLLYTLILCSSLASKDENNAVSQLTQPLNTLATSLYHHSMVSDITFPEGEYFTKDTIKANVTLRNLEAKENERKIELVIYDWKGNVIDTVSSTVVVYPRTIKEQEISWPIPEVLRSGRYYTEIRVLETDVSQGELDETQDVKSDVSQDVYREDQLFYKNRDTKGVLIFRSIDDFDFINDQVWGISSKTLGRSRLQPENVKAEDGCLTINLPAGTLDGGEIYSKELKSFGLYEARMKLPDAPSSITGFFFYKAPDYYYEIDIEVMNDPDGELYLTTYHNGSVSKSYAGDLGFDPTKEFHNYRIEYQEYSLAFYVDDIFIKEWKTGYPKTEMNLYINSWYPVWLDGRKPVSGEKLSVDWIKY